MKFSEQSKIKDLLGNQEAAAVLEKHMPGFAKHPQIGMVKDLSFKMMAGFPQAGIKPEIAKAVADDLMKIAD
jgi:hypothetical protein